MKYSAIFALSLLSQWKGSTSVRYNELSSTLDLEVDEDVTETSDINSDVAYTSLAAQSSRFDCNAGLWSWRTGWSQPKKEYCCYVENVQCNLLDDNQKNCLAYPNESEQFEFVYAEMASCDEPNTFNIVKVTVGDTKPF